ncbi:hypothetical protein [Luteolibacter luteus]|uniref:Uncharacterized protein n=1 Tax=Luteolibacter luteus TaxID=2728835 RepID=A0A858RNU3_9BACT|nr:hypothetical protein [Luteolibacter luteus]QJE97999.1 hypothetical protein HHL09_20135 [Luteolibacter luteus]
MTTKEDTCDCGATFTWEEPEKQDSWNPVDRPWHCPACIEADRIERERKARADHKEHAERFLSGFLPSRMAQTDRQDPRFNAKLWGNVEKWNPTDEKPWLGLIGPTGKCKTRVAYERIVDAILTFDQSGAYRIWMDRKGYDRGREWLVSAVSAVDYADAVRNQFGKGDEAKEAKDLLRLARRTGWLLLDDLGKCTHTPAVAAALFGLLDHRHAENLVTIWTANSRPDQFLANMPADVGAPLRGRLLECSTIFELK